ncbi:MULTISPECIES: hypothetical protein [unclassified Streptomyces]|uniref:hypothetical protein n=1 Tax=unclassified Streptomyces TaxID=2593676 RepID=UPI003647F4D6
MSGVPDMALLVIAAAIEDHRMLTPPDRSTPAGLAEVIAGYLVSSGWAVTRTAPPAPNGS